MNCKKISLASLSLMACFLLAQHVFAASNINNSSFAINATSGFEIMPVFNLWGYTGKHSIGDGQGLIPLFGDSSHVFYLAAEGKLGSTNNGWMAGTGLGYRKVVENERILGGYLLADYNGGFDNTKFFVANPGVESLGTIWDFRVNGYIPFAKRSWSEHKDYAAWKSDCGMSDDIVSSGHAQYDVKTMVHYQQETVAGLGADAEIGRTIPITNRLKGFIGGYYFDNKDIGHVAGGSARITWQATDNLGFEAIDTYDNYHHNTAMIGIKISLGGYKQDDLKRFGISARLMDPIEHNIAAVANGYAVPIRSTTAIHYGKDGGRMIKHDNIWFFNNNGNGSSVNAGTSASAVSATEDGTYEHPFTSLNSNNVNYIKANYSQFGRIDPLPLMYFNHGNYVLDNIHGFTDNTFDLPLGWGMYGRDNDYKSPAFDDSRAEFVGRINIDGTDIALAQQQATVLNSIRVSYDNGVAATINNGFSNAAVAIKNVLDVIIANTGINRTVTNGQAVGMYVENSTVDFVQLDFNCNKNQGQNTIASISLAGGNGYGIYSYSAAANSSSDNLNDAIANAITTINFNGGNNTITATAAANTSEQAFGIYSYNNVTASHNATATATTNINFNGGINSINAVIDGAGDTFGLYTYNNASSSTDGISVATMNINFVAGINQINAGVDDNGSAHGIYSNNYASMNDYGDAESLAFIRFDGGHNTINAVVNNAGTAYGIYFYNDASTPKTASATASVTVDFKNGNNLIEAAAGNSGTAYGIYTDEQQSDYCASIVTLNFLNPVDESVKFMVNAGGHRYGIYEDAASTGNMYMFDSNNEAMEPGNIKKYVEFISDSSSDVLGNAVVWSSEIVPHDWSNLWN